MAYEPLGGEELRTRYAGTPEVQLLSVPDGPLSLLVSYQIESARAGGTARFAVLRFASVFEFRLVESECYYAMTNPDDFEFAPIRILDSGHITLMIDRGRYRDEPPGKRFGGVVDEGDLKHYRIGFDDFGAIDVIALGVEVREDVRTS